MWWFYFYFRYTLRNAEYRLCLERNLDIHDDGHFEKQKPESAKVDDHDTSLDSTTRICNFEGGNELLPESERKKDLSSGNMGAQGLDELTPEAQEYILHLQSRLSSANDVCLNRWKLQKLLFWDR